MAASPDFKIYRDGEYVASCKYAEDAACLAGMSEGTVVKYRHRQVIWREGVEDFFASESWDGAAEVMSSRLPQRQQAAE